MAEDDEARQRRGGPDAYDVGRLLALSDGVFAIAMTLLVLTIPVPQLSQPVSDADLQGALRNVQGPLYSFALSFVLVGVYWMAHRRLLRGVVRTDGLLVWLNLFMLLFVCLVPFTSGVLSQYGNLATGVVVYAANLGLLGVLSLALRLQSWRGHLLSVPLSQSERRVAVIDALLSVAVFAASIPIALWSPKVATYSWLALLLVGVRVRLRRRRGR